jgi:hypothetical protein
MFGYKALYEAEKRRGDRLELELRQLNETIRTDSLRTLADAHRSLKAANETIMGLRKLLRREGRDVDSG